MFEIDELFELTIPGAFESKEDFKTFAQGASNKDLFDVIQEGAFSSLEEFNKSYPQKKKATTQSNLENSELDSSNTKKNISSASPKIDTETEFQIPSNSVIENPDFNPLVEESMFNPRFTVNPKAKIDNKNIDIFENPNFDSSANESVFNNRFLFRNRKPIEIKNPIETASPEDKDLLSQFDNLSTLSEDEINSIDKTISDQKSGDFGFFGNLKNAVVSSPSFGTFPNPFFSPKNISKVSDKDELVKNTIKKKQSDFIDNVGEVKQKKLKGLIEFRRFESDSERKLIEGKIQNIDTSLNQAKDSISTIDERFSEIEKRKSEIIELSKNSQATDLLKQEFNTLSGEQKTLVSKRNTIIEKVNPVLTERENRLSELENSTEKVGTIDQELDLLKRNYGIYDNAKDRVGIGFANMFANFKFTLDKGQFNKDRQLLKSILSQGKQRDPKFKDQVPAKYFINSYSYNEEEFDQETEELKNRRLRSVITGKEMLDKARGNLRPNISVADIDSFGDFVDFTIDGLSDNVSTLTQLAIPYVGQTSFLISQQADSEIEIRRKDQEAKDELKSVNDTLKSGVLNEQQTKSFEKRKKFLENKGQHSNTEVFLASTGMAVSELIFSRLFGEVKRFNVGKRILANAGKKELNSEIRRSVKDQFKNVFKETKAVFGDALEEGFLDEFLTNFSQNAINKYYLGDEKVGLFDNSLDAIGGGLNIGAVMSASPRVTGSFLNHVSNNKRKNEVFKNVSQISELQKYLDQNSDLDDSAKDVVKSKISNLIDSNRKIINSTTKEFDNLTIEEQKELMSISDKKTALQISLQKLSSKKELSETEELLKSEIETEIKQIDTTQDNMLSQNITIEVNGNKTITNKDDFLKFISKDENIQKIVDGDTNVTIDNDQVSGKLLENRIKEFKKTAKNPKGVPKELQDFASQIGETTDISQFIANSTKIRVGKTNVILSPKGDAINIESIKTDSNSLNQGSARTALQKVTKLADEKGKTLKLNVVPQNDQTSPEKLVEFYESEGFVKDKDFEKEDGGIMTRVPKESDSFSSIDNIIKEEGKKTETEVVETKKETTPIQVETSSNTYDVTLENGELKISPKLGNPTITPSERTSIINEYISKNDFSKGDLANFENTPNASETQQSEIIAETSNNAIEILEEIRKVQQRESENTKVLEVTKESAISNALSSFALNNESKKEVTDLGSFYTNTGFRKNKEKKSIDQIREIAQSELGQDISFQDVLDFLNQYPTISDYKSNNQVSESTVINDLKDRFKQITGINPTDSNLNKIKQPESIKKENLDISKDTLEDDVPFQTESNQNKISGEALRDVVDRLKKTGLASKVEILTDAQIRKRLDDIGIDSSIRKQDSQEQEEKRRTQNRKAIELRNKLRSQGFSVSEIHTSKTKYGVSTYINFEDKSGVLREFRISDHPVYNPERVKNEYHYTTESNLDEIVETVNSDIEKTARKTEIEKTKQEKLEVDQKWDRIKETFKGLVFKSANKTRASFPKIRSGKGSIRTNIFREELGDGLYNYLWTEPSNNKDQIPNKPHKSFIQAINEDRLDRDVKFQKELSDKGVLETPNGFVHNDVVYLNRDKVKTDTPIHEFGHLWNSYIKENHKDVYKKGLDLIKDTEYHKEVKQNQAYNNLSEEAKLEEALAQAIGEKGVKILREAKKKSFASWFKTLFNRIAKGLGLRNISAKKLSETTLEEYTNLAAAELLSGQEIISRPKEKTKRNQQENVNKIDIVVSNQLTLQKERKRLTSLIRSKKTVSDAVKNEIIKYINEQITAKNVDQVKKREIKGLLNSIKRARTKINLLRAFQKVDEIFLTVENRVILNEINSVLDKKLTKKDFGRRKANLVSEDAAFVLNTIKEVVKGKGKESERLSNAFDRREEILEKTDISDKEYLEVEALSTAINILTAKTTKNKNTAKDRLTEALETVNEIYNNGRSSLLAQKQETQEQLEEALTSYKEDADGSGKRSALSNKELDAQNKSIKNAFGRTLFQIGSGWLTGSLDSVMTIISKKGGESRDSSPLVQLVNRMKQKETLKKRRMQKFSNQIIQSQKDIFGSQKKADIELNKRTSFEIIRQKTNEEGDSVDTPVEISLTNSQLLNLWMNYQNENLRVGLAKNGFTDEFFEKLNLSEKILDYGQELFDTYEDLYADTNEVYKKMYYHSMGKEDNYAGKVRRDQIEVDETTLSPDGNAFSVNTTGYGSQKERASTAPIQASDVNENILRAISESSHFVAYAEIHREYSKMVNDDEFGQIIRLNNGKNGDLIMNKLRYHKMNDLEKGGVQQAFKILDFFGRNITRSTLALKTKVGLTQVISFTNGAIDMPPKPVKPFLSYYDPVRLVKTLNQLKNESEYLKTRYDVEGIENAVTGLSDIASKSEFSFENNTIEANRKQFARFMNKAFNYSLVNVKYGDMAGLAGGIPAYLAWVDKYKSRGFSEKIAKQKALLKFEASVDRSQQTISTFGKSEFQKNPILRYFAMFATSPIQNIQNANFHWRELYRGITKGQDAAKGTNLRNMIGVLNYQFAQPMLYTYIAQLMAGNIFRALGFGDEEPDDVDKTLLNSFIFSNYGSIPILGGMGLMFMDQIQGKDFTFGGLVSSPLVDFFQGLGDDYKKMMNAKNKKSQEIYRRKVIKQLTQLGFSIPSILTEGVLDSEMYLDDDIDAIVKLEKALGWSNFTIKQSRTKRISREKSEKERRKLKKKFEKSEIKFKKKKKIDDIFKGENER